MCSGSEAGSYLRLIDFVVQVPSEMLQPIMKSKYPDISEQEEAI